MKLYQFQSRFQNNKFSNVFLSNVQDKTHSNQRLSKIGKIVKNFLYLVEKSFYTCSKANRQNVKISHTRLTIVIKKVICGNHCEAFLFIHSLV